MIIGTNIERCAFVRQSVIVSDAANHFGLDSFDLDDTINENASWTWGDTNRVMVGNHEYVNALAEALADLKADRVEIDTYCVSLQDFLVTNHLYVDIAN